MTLDLSDADLADLVAAIDVSLGEGQAGLLVARSMYEQGFDVGPEARTAVEEDRARRRNVSSCSCLTAQAMLRGLLLRASAGEAVTVTCVFCGRPHKGRVAS